MTDTCSVDSAAPKVCVVVIDGLPRGLLSEAAGDLTFLRERTPHWTQAVSCFPSTTGPAYFPLLAGTTPGRANVTGIRWFDRHHSTRSRFPHRGLRSYVGPDARRMVSDTAARTIFEHDAWPVSSPVQKDSPKRGEKSRDLLWAFAHFTERWDVADRRTNWKLGRALAKGRPIVFAVFPSVDEYGHTLGFGSGHPRQALLDIDRMLEQTLDGFEGEVLVTADHGLTATETHLDLRRLVEQQVGSTVAFPLIARPNPTAVVCESGNAMANVYLRGADRWAQLPETARCRELASSLLQVDGIDSVAIRGEQPGTAELLTRSGSGVVGFDAAGLHQQGDVFSARLDGATPERALERSIDDEQPDAAFALVSLFASPRAGDLLVSARVGHDLRDAREWPTHHASHGALHRHHPLVPYLSSAPLDGRPRRTLDIFADTLVHAGIPLARYPQSDSRLLADGAWRPGVAE